MKHIMIDMICTNCQYQDDYVKSVIEDTKSKGGYNLCPKCDVGRMISLSEHQEKQKDKEGK